MKNKLTDKLFILRGLDLTRKTDLFAVAWAIVSLLVLYLYSYFIITQDFASLLNLTFSFSVSILGFCAYLIGREYDRKDSLTGVLAQVATTVVVFLIDPTVKVQVLVPIFVLLVMRILTRKTKSKLDIPSVVILFLFTGLLTYLYESWVFFFVLSIGYLLDNWVRADGELNWIFGLLSVVASIGMMLWLGSTRYVLYLQPLTEIVLGGFVAATLVYVVASNLKFNKEKKDSESLLGLSEIVFSRIFVYIAGAVLLYFGFPDALSTISPLIVVVFAYIPVHFFNK